MNKLPFLLLAAALCLVQPLSARAEPFEENVNYFAVPENQKFTETDKIEVVMFVWYGCGACYALHRPVSEWAKSLPPDVTFVQLPALFSSVWRLHGRVYLTLEAMGAPHETHDAAFEAIQIKRYKLRQEEDLPGFLALIGVEQAKFMETFRSKEVEATAARIDTLIKKYDLCAVPAIIVNGKYKFDTGTVAAKDYTNLAEYLINKERSAQSR